MAKKGIILDGYTISHTVDETDFHPAVSIKFRPVTKTEYADITNRIGKQDDPVKGEQIAAEVMAKQISEWDLTDHEDRAVPVTVEMLGKLEPHLSATLFNLVMGYSPVSDRDAAIKN